MCDPLEVWGRASVVRDEGEGSKLPIQYIWMFRFEGPEDVERVACRLQHMKWGPFGKQPYALFRFGSRDLVALESRHRYPRYERELRARLAADEATREAPTHSSCSRP